MLSFSASLKVFLAVEPCDMRKSFNGLSALVGEHLREDPRRGARLNSKRPAKPRLTESGVTMKTGRDYAARSCE